MTDKNLDQLVADVAELNKSVAGLSGFVSAENSKISDLTSQLAGMNADDPRAADLHAQITAATASINSAVGNVATAASSAAAASPSTDPVSAPAAAGLGSIAPTV